MEEDNKPATLKTIAQSLGFSFSTVSKALRDHPSISEETRRVIKQYAQELNYNPNAAARALRSSTSKIIGFVLNDLENPIQSRLVKGISNSLALYGYTSLLCDSQFSSEIERANIHSLLRHQPDSIIITPVGGQGGNLQLLAPVAATSIVIGTSSDTTNLNCVAVRGELAGYLSAKKLLDLGHKHCIALSAPGEVPFEIEYYRGIKKAYSERGLDSGTCRFVNCIPSIESGMDAILEQYRSYKTEIGQAFTGVMAFCDMLAFGAYKAAAKLGLRIPHDLSVIGYDNIPFAAMATPPLTTIDFPVVRIAEYCSEILLSCLVRGERNVMRYILEPSLVERGSTARAGGGL